MPWEIVLPYLLYGLPSAIAGDTNAWQFKGGMMKVINFQIDILPNCEMEKCFTADRN